VSAEHVTRLREHLAARDQRMRRIQRISHLCILALVILGAWSASRVALGDDSQLFNAFFAGLTAGFGLRWNHRLRSQWLTLRADFEREIEQLEKTAE
jgi:hypothetical protein